MMAAEFRAKLKQLGLSMTQAARRLNVTERNVRRWAAGSALVPPGVAANLRLIVAQSTPGHDPPA